MDETASLVSLPAAAELNGGWKGGLESVSNRLRFAPVVMTLSVVATVCAVTRLKIRWNGQLGLDDYILAFSLILIWLQAVGATLCTSEYHKACGYGLRSDGHKAY
jgi:hypothetical protein